MNKEDRPISLNEACKKVPGGVSLATINRWRMNGVLGGIRLATYRVGGRRYTNLRSIREFIQAVTAAADGVDRTPPPRGRQRRVAEIAAADRELDDELG